MEPSAFTKFAIIAAVVFGIYALWDWKNDACREVTGFDCGEAP